jgi:hypothetical protein
MLHLQAERARGNGRLDKNPSLSRDLWLASRFRDRDFTVGYFLRRLSDPVRCLVDATSLLHVLVAYPTISCSFCEI